MVSKDIILLYMLTLRAFGTKAEQTYNDFDSMLKYLFNESRYNARVRPLENQSNVIKIGITHHLNSIESLDISTRELIITGYLKIEWTDEMLTWDPARFSGRTRIQLPKGKFWKPDIYLTNGLANEESSIYGSGFSPAWITYQGSIVIIPAGSFITKCDIDPTFYPYDMHNCIFQFVVLNHDDTELVFHSPLSHIDISNINENGEWEIKKTDAKVLLFKQKNVHNVKISMFQSSVVLKRRSAFEIINSLTPITLILFLNMATCFVRPESGERITFAITLYLSLLFAAITSVDRMPKNSLKMPILTFQFQTINLINTVGVTWSIFIVYYASKPVEIKIVPGIILKIILRRRKTKNNNSKIRLAYNASTKESRAPSDDKNANINVIEKEDHVEEKPNDITRLEVAEALDIVYFWVILFSIMLLFTVTNAYSFKSMMM